MFKKKKSFHRIKLQTPSGAPSRENASYNLKILRPLLTKAKQVPRGPPVCLRGRRPRAAPTTARPEERGKLQAHCSKDVSELQVYKLRTQAQTSLR